MSSLKFYGKVDESDQVILLARRRTRKRITIIALSTIVLVSIVCAAVFGTVAHKNDNDNTNADDANNGNNSLSNAVKVVCDVTLYKDACYRSLGPMVQLGKVTPEDLFKLSIQVALVEVNNAAKKFYDQGNFDVVNSDRRTKEALKNCHELLGLAIDHLNSSLSSGENSSLFDVLEDLKTWLSAAGTYQQTCIDGLEETKESLKNTVESYLQNSTEFTSNSLSIITWIDKATTSVNLRRLLSFHHHNEEPKWLHSKDRKLLQKPNLKKIANIVVAKDGSGKYKTISEALNNVDAKSNNRTVIYVKKGIYIENVEVDKTKWNVMIIGDGKNASIISGSLNFVDGTPTFSTATVAIKGKNFIARDMGFANTAGPSKHQAVALLTSSDQSVYYRCQFDAFQDTLYAQANRQFFRECDIYGTVDFIFGNSAVIIQNSNILPRVPLNGQQNTITAQGKSDPNMNTGISFQNCTISPFGNLGFVQTYLGRPWRNYSTTVFMQSNISNFINPSGWLPWVGNSAPDTIFYAEYQNIGEGASTKNRVKWKGVITNVTTKQASKFTVKAFISGNQWISASGAPYRSSL
ncbi:putative pectinesterase [Lupinus albus]|uniref:Pectinesterase n=1 Tax=Lupinus albus TaxID=3870 RepID=A0A6A4R6J1_LUPAL|nr:putative pectinesterase [Lupinus albus]